jgi:beta-glucanase (GH16 family)
MKTSIAILALLSLVSAEKLIFSDDFNTLNFKNWQHELTMSGGGNWEFEWYVNNRSNSYVRDGVLYIKPTLTEDAIGDSTMRSQSVNIWGGSPADQCTMNAFYGCERNAAASGNMINPIRSARLRSVNSFHFQYGRVEVKAKLPKGDWLWPAIWMLPAYNEYGNWPASGEIDIMESRGNNEAYPGGGHDHFASTLHWGPNWDQNRYPLTHKDFKHTESLGNAFHTYGLYWNEKGLYTYLDDPSNKVLEVDFTEKSFWDRGTFPASFDNPWKGESNAAPFNREFYLIFNLAVGGTSGYFPEGQGGKPWSDTDPHSVNAFYNNRGAWYPSWKGEDAALQIDSVKVWSLDSTEATFL